MKKMLKPAIFVFIGILIAFPVFSLTYYTMVRTSTPGFCASCHEIQPAFNAWKTSTHVNNAQGFVANCMDCHLPAPHDTINFFYTKTAHGLKDLIVHVLQDSGAYDHKKNREAAYASFKNEQCLKCHRNLLNIPDKRGAMLAHRTVLYPKKGYEKKCVDCHRNLVHVDSEIYKYKEKQAPYRGLGI
jgi:cytochrome c-type protein NapC/trimethylamine-N-oxide reductase cytochrome c-type subunit TorC